MKRFAIALLFLLSTTVCYSQATLIGLSTDSTIPPATIATNVMKYCSKANISITTDNTKAQYILQADFTGYGWSFDDTAIYQATHEPDAGAALLLFDSKGNVVYSKQTKSIHNAFKDMCKDYFKKK
jgi:hypothetical protein